MQFSRSASVSVPQEGRNSGSGQTPPSKNTFKVARLVSIFLESAELRVKRRKDLTLSFWRKKADNLLKNHDVPLLASSGTVSHTDMKRRIDTVYTAFDRRRKQLAALQADQQDLEELEADIKMISQEKE